MGRVVDAPPVAFLQHTTDVVIVELEQSSARVPDPHTQFVYLGDHHELHWKQVFGEDFQADAEKPRRKGIVQDCKSVRGAKVLKRGIETGPTTGTLNGIYSKRRKYGERVGWADELCIMGDKREAFTDDGDSGAVVLTGDGMVLGLCTGGMGPTDATDVTYATPMSWLLEQLGAARAVSDVSYANPSASPTPIPPPSQPLHQSLRLANLYTLNNMQRRSGSRGVAIREEDDSLFLLVADANEAVQMSDVLLRVVMIGMASMSSTHLPGCRGQ